MIWEISYKVANLGFDVSIYTWLYRILFNLTEWSYYFIFSKGTNNINVSRRNRIRGTNIILIKLIQWHVSQQLFSATFIIFLSHVFSWTLFPLSELLIMFWSFMGKFFQESNHLSFCYHFNSCHSLISTYQLINYVCLVSSKINYPFSLILIQKSLWNIGLHHFLKFWCSGFHLVFQIWPCYVVQEGLNSWSSYHVLLRVGITGVCPGFLNFLLMQFFRCQNSVFLLIYMASSSHMGPCYLIDLLKFCVYLILTSFLTLNFFIFY